MRLLRLVPNNTHIGFMRWRKLAFAWTLFVVLGSLASMWLTGLNLGLDFVGGILIEVRSASTIDLVKLRAQLGSLGLGETSLQVFGGGMDLMIRVQTAANGGSQEQAVAAIASVMHPDFEILRTEFLGPQVGQEFLRSGILATLLAIMLIGIYVWVRFDWQFGLSAVVTMLHDVIATFGLLSLFRLEFNLIIVAAILTIAGYSINDTVVLFDRVRENLRRFKTMPITALIDLSVNQCLARTVMTCCTTLLAVLALLVFGGPVLRDFSLALAWGLLVGTYSSVFISSALLLHLPSLRQARDREDENPVGPPSATRSPTGGI